MTTRSRSVAPLDLSASTWAVLGVAAERPTHGFAISAELAPGGPLGAVWTVPRPVVYRELKKLVGLGLVEAGETRPSDKGPDRTTMTVTSAGQAALARWLPEPVDHVREVRALLLLKLALMDRRGVDPRPLLDGQRERLRPQLTGLERRCEELDGFDRTLARWRLASTQATLAFLDAALTDVPLPGRSPQDDRSTGRTGRPNRPAR